MGKDFGSLEPDLKILLGTFEMTASVVNLAEPASTLGVLVPRIQQRAKQLRNLIHKL